MLQALMLQDVIDFLNMAQRERAGLNRKIVDAWILLVLFRIRHFHYSRYVKASTIAEKKTINSWLDLHIGVHPLYSNTAAGIM